jgi:hypothetical protein
MVLNPKPLGVLVVLLSLVSLTLSAGAQTELPHMRSGERYPVGMFCIGIHEDESLEYATLDSIWRGTPGGFEACNIIHVYEHAWHNWPVRAVEVEQRILAPIAAFNSVTGADIGVVIGPLYGMFVDCDDEGTLEPARAQHAWLDHTFGNDQAGDMLAYVGYLVGSDYADVIAGWQLCDEAFLTGQDLAEYYKVVDLVKQIDPDRTLYTALPGKNWQPGVEDSTPNVGNRDTPRKRRWVNWNGGILVRNLDGLPVEFVYEFEDDPPETVVIDESHVAAIAGVGEPFVVDEDRYPAPDGAYDGEWYATMWEADVTILWHYGPTWTRMGSFFPKEVATVRGHIRDHGGKRQGGAWQGDWELHLDFSALKGYYGEWPYDPSEFDEYPAHTDLHRNIRRGLELNADGVWLFSWDDCATGCNPARAYWTSNELWAEAVESEFEGWDRLVLGSNAADSSMSFAWRFNVPDYSQLLSGSLGTGGGIHSDLMGTTWLRATTLGDFDGDGDDELVSAFEGLASPGEGSHVYIAQNPTSVGDATAKVLTDEFHLLGAQVDALASGDVDGDGLDELVLSWSHAGSAWVEIFKYHDGWETGQLYGMNGEHQMAVQYSYPDSVFDALAVGDFDGNGIEELVWARNRRAPSGYSAHSIGLVDGVKFDAVNSAFSAHRPLCAGDMGIQPHCGGAITAMTAADYDGDLVESLVLGISLEMPGEQLWDQVHLYDFGPDNYDILTGERQPFLYDIGDYTALYDVVNGEGSLVAIGSGDFEPDGDDESVAVLSRLPQGAFTANHLYLIEGESPTSITELPLTTPLQLVPHPITAVAAGDPVPAELQTSPGKPRHDSPMPPPTGKGDAPSAFALYRPVPNPANPVSSIRFDVPEPCKVTITVYDLAGRVVTRLVDWEFPPGRHSVSWTGVDARGNRVASGVYFLRMEAPGFEEKGKIVILK